MSFFAVNSTRSFERCYDFFRYVVVFYLMIKCIKEKRQLKHLMLLILLCGLFLGYQAYNKPRYGGRLEGVGTPDTSDANNFALLLVTIIPCGLPLVISKEKYLKYPVPLCAVFILNGIVLCNSRGAMLALITIVVMIIGSIKLPKLRRNIIILSVLGGLVFVCLADPVFWERFKTIGDSAEKDQGSGRLDIWKNGIEMVHDYPMGTGGGGFQLLSRYYLPEENISREGIRSSHNTYLLVLVEQGYIGIVIYMGFVVHVIWLLRKGRRVLVNKTGMDNLNTCDNSFLYIATIAVESALWGNSVGSIFGDRLYYEYFYILAAMAVSLYYLIEAECKKNLCELEVSAGVCKRL